MRYLLPLLGLAGLFVPLAARAQVGVGTTSPDAKSALDIRATDKGLLIPRLTAAQRTAITAPPQGLMVYQTDGTTSGGAQTGFWYHAGAPAAWVFLSPGGGGLALPYAGTSAGPGVAFAVSNSATGAAVQGTASNGPGVYGLATDPVSPGVLGDNSGSGPAVFGRGSSGPGLQAQSVSGPALLAAKASLQTGRAAQITNTDAANDSTLTYLSTPGDRPALRAVNTSTSAQAAIRGVKQSASTDGIGVEGVITSGATGNAAGVLGNDKSGSGGGSGVIGLTAGGYGVRGIASASGGFGVSGSATDGYGVIGSSQSGNGVYGASQANVNTTAGVLGVGNGGSSAVGVLGTTQSGYGVRGVASASGGYGVQGIATNSYGVTGTSSSGPGLYGISTSNYGAQGVSSTGSGVFGQTAASGAGLAGVEGSSTNSSGTGVLGTTTSGYGVRGEATGSSGFGITGIASGTNGIAVLGSATGAASGVTGQASGTGRAGYFNQNSSSGTANALEVQNSSLGRTAFFNQSNANNAANTLEVQNAGTGSTALFNQSNSSSISNAVTVTQVGTGASLSLYGGGGLSTQFNTYSGEVRFNTTGGSNVASISSFSGFGAGSSLSLNLAGALNSGIDIGTLSQVLRGNWYVGNNLSVTGSLSKGGGSFKIDHPLDPANQYLYHSFVESPDMMNVYNGNITLDANGEATVQLPDWFEALNRDFRYQLTPIGAAFTPYVLAEVAGNKFRIAGQPGGKVSWQVTGIRHDKWADANRIPTEQAKEPANQGKYLHPTLFGQPVERGIGYQPQAIANPAAPTQKIATTPSAATPAISRHE